MNHTFARTSNFNTDFAQTHHPMVSKFLKPWTRSSRTPNTTYRWACSPTTNGTNDTNTSKSICLFSYPMSRRTDHRMTHKTVTQPLTAPKPLNLYMLTPFTTRSSNTWAPNANTTRSGTLFSPVTITQLNRPKTIATTRECLNRTRNRTTHCGKATLVSDTVGFRERLRARGTIDWRI